MAFYTFIMELGGGTYISQVEAKNAVLACVKWAHSLDVSQIKGIGPKSKLALIEQMKNNSPVALNGLSNAWCTGAFVGREYALINFVQTEWYKSQKRSGNEFTRANPK